MKRVKTAFFSLIYLLRKKNIKMVLDFFKKHPVLCFKGFLAFFLAKPQIIKRKKLSFYRLRSMREAEKILKNPETQLFLGLSYCQKPLKCPNRFSQNCLETQCSLSKNCKIYNFKKNITHPKDDFLIIATLNELGEFFLKNDYFNPKKPIFFIISSCPLSQKFFEDFLQFFPLSVKGIGIPLNGKICQNFQEFKRAEEGKQKEKTTLFLDHETQLKKLLYFRKRSLDLASKSFEYIKK